MAVKWAIVNYGNWNAGATWNDGIVPTADDELYTNGYNVDVNSAVVAKSITNKANADLGIAGGGGVRLMASPAIINANLIVGGSPLLIRQSGLSSLTINEYCKTTEIASVWVLLLKLLETN